MRQVSVSLLLLSKYFRTWKLNEKNVPIKRKNFKSFKTSWRDITACQNYLWRRSLHSNTMRIKTGRWLRRKCDRDRYLFLNLWIWFITVCWIWSWRSLRLGLHSIVFSQTCFSFLGVSDQTFTFSGFARHLCKWMSQAMPNIAVIEKILP